MSPTDSTAAAGDVNTHELPAGGGCRESLDGAIADRKPPVISPPHDRSAADTGAGTLHHWLFLVGAVLVIAASFMLDVRDSDTIAVAGLDRPMPGICTFRRVTGQPCPGCGLTRCFVSIAHGDMVSALAFNAAGLVIFCIVVAQIPYRAIQLWRIRRGRRPLQVTRFAIWLLWFTVALMLAQWLFRLSGGISAS